MEEQLQQLTGNLQALSERLALEGRYVDGAIASGALQAIRALYTRLQQTTAPPKPPLELVPEVAEG